MDKEEKKMTQFSRLMSRNFGDDDNYGDTQNIDGIDREAVFQAGMSIAHEIFGDDTDEKIVWSMVDSAIDKAMKQNGDTQVAIGILKGMYTKNESFAAKYDRDEVFKLFKDALIKMGAKDESKLDEFIDDMMEDFDNRIRYKVLVD